MIRFYIIILANQFSGLFDERSCKKEYTRTIWFYFDAQGHISKETSRKSFDIKCNNSQGMQKWPRKGKSQVFKKLSLAFDQVWFLNFVDINIEIFAGVNFATTVNETLYFWHPVLSCRFWTFWNFFSEIYVALINWDIVFLHL